VSVALAVHSQTPVRSRTLAPTAFTPRSLSWRVTTYSGCSAGHPVAWAAFDEGHIAAPQDGAGGDSGSRTWLLGGVWKFFTQF
jgi:hypothetical protein